MSISRPDVVLSRILCTLGDELVSAADEEITAAARELGMDPSMKGSAAFVGLNFLFDPRLPAFCGFLPDVQSMRRASTSVSIVSARSKGRSSSTR